MDVGIGNNQLDEEVAFLNETHGSENAHLHRNEGNEGDCVTPHPPSLANRRPHWSTYDPFSPSRQPPAAVSRGSLLDDDFAPGQSDQRTTQRLDDFVPAHTSEATQRLDDFLEMEEDESSRVEDTPPPRRKIPYTPPQAEPIITSSGLLLTHRKTTPAPRPQTLKPNEHYMSPLPRNLHRERFEVEGPSYMNHNNNLWNLWRRRVSLVWIWLGLSALIFCLGSLVLWHHVSQADRASSQSNSDIGVAPAPIEEKYADRIVLIPMASSEAFEQQQQIMYQQSPPWQQQQQLQTVMYPLNHQQQPYDRYASYQQQQPYDPALFPHRRLSEWAEAFEAWARTHRKTYETEEERQYRLRIWMENHQRTAAKNAKHGPCPLMQRPVFGNSNHFQDLTQDEFKSQFLNAQRKPRKLESPHNKGTLGPHISTTRHVDVHHRVIKQQQQHRPGSQKTYKCKWYDVSCNLRWFIETYFYGFFGVGRTMEPAYDKDSYPNAVDWRDYGAVTDVRSQNNCGACWAITAVETLESALFLATNELLTLSETEVILCQENCEMCAGGWPEDAFDYIMENGGIPLQEDLEYNGSYLYKITSVLAGESDELSSSTITAYKQKVCPADNGSGSGSKDSGGSQDEGNENNYYTDDAAPYNFARYGGALAGYGYATDPCLCYTDGSGCSCNSQDENTAVRNVATYGPAVVCVDASDWQDYAGGILSSASGCSAEYLDVNHCAQVVGYAFAENGGYGGSGDNKSGSGDQQNSGNSQDNDNRNLGSGSGDNNVSYEGYWIVKNSWSEYWGMNGYAYVAMGENTCGILNDMLQAYTDD